MLLHGVPKTAYYWRKVVPLLTHDHIVVVPDMRGFGDSKIAKDGHDLETMGDDAAQLMNTLGHDQYTVVGEDWGATAGLALAAQYPDRVEKLAFLEMLMDGFGLQDWSFLTEENIGNQCGSGTSTSTPFPTSRSCSSAVTSDATSSNSSKPNVMTRRF